MVIRIILNLVKQEWLQSLRIWKWEYDIAMVMTIAVVLYQYPNVITNIYITFDDSWYYQLHISW